MTISPDQIFDAITIENCLKTAPMLEGEIKKVWLEDDIIHIQATKEAPDLGILESYRADEGFVFIGAEGYLASYGYSDSTQLIGKKCQIRTTDQHPLFKEIIVLSLETLEGDFHSKIWAGFY